MIGSPTTGRTTFDSANSGGATFDGAKAKAFGGRMMSILTGSLLSSMVDIGHRTGLFAAAVEGPATCEQLAAGTGLCERYVREWLGAVTTGGIVEYDEATEAFFLPPERAALLTTPAGVGPLVWRTPCSPGTSTRGQTKQARKGQWAWEGPSILVLADNGTASHASDQEEDEPQAHDQ